jgi:hypothetical protein
MLSAMISCFSAPENAIHRLRAYQVIKTARWVERNQNFAHISYTLDGMSMITREQWQSTSMFSQPHMIGTPEMNQDRGVIKGDKNRGHIDDDTFSEQSDVD